MGRVQQGAQLFKIKDFKALIACVKINELLLGILLSAFARAVFFFFFFHVWLKSIRMPSCSTADPKARALHELDHRPVGRLLKILLRA